MKKYTMKPSALWIICIVIALATAAASYLVWRYLSAYEILMFVLIAIFIFLGFLFGFWLLPAYFRRTVICLAEGEITIHTGIIFLRRAQVKLRSAQYVTRIASPLAKYSGFNFLAIHALGGNLLLPFLRQEDCDELEKALSEAIRGCDREIGQESE